MLVLAQVWVSSGAGKEQTLGFLVKKYFAIP